MLRHDYIRSEQLIPAIKERLQQPLPGSPAQRHYAPELSYGRHRGPVSHQTRPAAVIVPLFRRRESWHILLTKRASGLPDHAGQISFPGGGVDPHENTAAAALRELNEELGIEHNQVELLGCLSDVYVFASDFLVTPHVGVVSNLDRIEPNLREVAQVLEIPLVDLPVHPQLARCTIERGGLRFAAPHVQWRDHQIWGATVTMLGELSAIFDQVTSPRR